MKWFTLAFAILAVCGMASARTIPNGMVFYQSAPAYYKRAAPVPQHMMYVQYMPSHANRRQADGGVSAFAAGDTVATNTFLREYGVPEKAAIEYEPQIADEQGQNGGASSIAEAFPEQNLVAPERTDYQETDFDNDPLKVSIANKDTEISITQQTEQADLAPPAPLGADLGPPAPGLPEFDAPEATESTPELVIEIKKEKKPKELIPQEDSLPEPEPTSAFEVPAETPSYTDLAASGEEPSDLSAELPAEAPTVLPAAAPAKTPLKTPPAPSPAKAYIPPRKKIRVELESAESAEEEDDEPAYYVPPRPQRKKGTKAAVAPKKPAGQNPAGTYFPVDFGGATGGAIAIANSFSTGEGGSASSTATAYGSPAVARSKAAHRRH